jgi:TolA-binding protein
MKYLKILKICGFSALLILMPLLLEACSTFNYKTYDEKQNEGIDDPEPNYELTLDQNFQDFTSYMFIGNRVENFGTYFNTYFNAKENFDDAYDDYVSRVLANYNERQDSIFARPNLSQESKDKFNTAIQKASKVIQYHKSSEFMDKSVLLVGKAYYYLGDYLKAERKFGEFISRLQSSRYLDEALLYLAKTQLRLDNEKPAMERLNNLTKTSHSKEVISESYQAIAEYYLNKKDYDNAITNFKKAIELSGDNEFKAQMQFLVASVTSKSNPKSAATEFDKVLDYNASFDLEYISRYNNAKNLILSANYNKAKPLLEDLVVKYKDNLPNLGQISYLKGFYNEEKKDYKNAIREYYEVIRNFPGTVPSSDASFRIANYYENKNDYLNAYRYYRFSTEQSSAGGNFNAANSRKNVFKRYFELRSTIIGTEINTDYDSDFKKKTNSKPEEDEIKKNEGDLGKSGGLWGTLPADSLTELDSFKIKEEKIADATFELAELFLYDLNRTDSCEYYLQTALKQSDDYEFTAKVLFALSAVYRKNDNSQKSDEILKQIVTDYPLSTVANSSRRLLNMTIVDDYKGDSSDSLYSDAENKFVNKEYLPALSAFRELVITYPASVHLDKALYGAGWIYENVLMKSDSAYLYYSSLIKSVPNSEAAAIVTLKVEEYESFNNTLIDTSGTQNVKDSTGVNDSLNNDSNHLKDETNEQKEEVKDKNVEIAPDNIMKKEGEVPLGDPTNEKK